jgi:hypothetical protein
MVRGVAMRLVVLEDRRATSSTNGVALGPFGSAHLGPGRSASIGGAVPSKGRARLGRTVRDSTSSHMTARRRFPIGAEHEQEQARQLVDELAVSIDTSIDASSRNGGPRTQQPRSVPTRESRGDCISRL